MSRHRKKAQRTRPAAAPPVATIEGAFALVAKMPVNAQARYDEARGLASRGLCDEARRLYAELEGSLGEAANALSLPRRIADRNWAVARAWLADALAGG
jgi:hypothetical protein